GGAQAVDRFQRDVDRRVAADTDVVTVEVVVDGRGHPDHREAFAREARRARLRAVAADHHQSIDRPVAEVAEGLGAAGRLGEFRAAGAAEDRAARLDDAADVPRRKRLERVGQQPGITVAYGE